MFSQSSYLYVLELKLLCLSSDIWKLSSQHLANAFSLHIAPHF